MRHDASKPRVFGCDGVPVPGLTPLHRQYRPAMRHSIIDVDDPASWPEPIKRFVQNYVSTQNWEDGVDADLDSRLNSLLEGEAVLAYHHTRLMPSERRDIQRNGMLMTDDDSVVHKLELAVAAEAISHSEALALDKDAVHRGSFGQRADQVCLSLGRSVWDDRRGIEGLLGYWGGETLSWQHRREGTRFHKLLSSIGDPCRVTLHYEVVGERLCFSWLSAFASTLTAGVSASIRRWYWAG